MWADDTYLCGLALIILICPLVGFTLQAFFGGKLPRQGDWLPTTMMFVPLCIASYMMVVLLGSPEGVVAQKYEAIIDTALQYENELRIQAFHGNEVSEESVRFVCWAYQEIQHVITAYSLDAASIPQIQALMGAPIGVEILASTHTQSGDPLCEVAATGIYWEGGQTAVTTQFHPELDESLLTTSEGWAPAWEDMKRSDGIRLLARMLCACLR